MQSDFKESARGCPDGQTFMKLEKTYDPSLYENRLYEQWEKSGAFGFHSGKEPFVTLMPPPNANADLHLGYALDSQLKDILARWHRLNGRAVLLLPGADHAGFETWAVYEKHLNSSGKSRFDFEREELYRQVHDFVLENKRKMEDQIRRLGISCSWERFTFTLDEKVIGQTYETFRQMWEQGLIYRGKRLVNYCVAHGTGFSDLEVSHKETAGKLYFIDYRLKESGHVTIATTRPETLLGDVAVAVNPADNRHSSLIGKTLILPLAEREIPLIGDKRVVPDFGTGALKITPGHNFIDFEIAEDAGLTTIEVIDKEGRMTGPIPEKFRGLDVAEARGAVLAELQRLGALAKTEEYTHQVGCCYKCGNILEPLLADQWFVKMKPLAEAAIKELNRDAIRFYPRSKQAELVSYLGQLHDWNISRQIAWGIPIPSFKIQPTKTIGSLIRASGKKHLKSTGKPTGVTPTSSILGGQAGNGRSRPSMLPKTPPFIPRH